MDTKISNKDDVIDSRDVIVRIEELEAVDGIEDKINNLVEDDEAAELVALRALAAEGETACDWTYGEMLIRESYFEDYARELAEDIHGHAIRDASWPFDCIDWEAAAEALKQDYAEVDYDGVAYLIRT